MRTLLANLDALTTSLTTAYPELPPDLITHAANQIASQAYEEWSCTHTDALVPPDAVLLTDLEACPEDADYVAAGPTVLLVPGPSLFQSRRIASPKEVQGVPVGQHYLYRWALAVVSERDAKLYAKHGLDSPSISATNKDKIRTYLRQHPHQPRALPQPSTTPIVHVSAQRNYQLVTPETADSFLTDIAKAADQGYVGYDTETMPVPGWDSPKALKPATRPRWDTVVGMSFSASPGTGWYLNTGPAGDHAPSATLEAALRLLSDKSVAKVGHNMQFDMMMTRHTFGVRIEGPIHDSMSAAFLLGHTDQHLKLKKRAFEDLGFRMTDFTDLVGKDSRYPHMGMVPLSMVAPYAGADADAPCRLMDLYLPQLEAQGLMPCYELEQELLPVLHEMQWNGMRVDPDVLAVIGQELEQSLAEEQAKLDLLAGHPINVKAAAQLQHLLYVEKGYIPRDPRGRRKGGHSTDKETLMELLLFYPKDPLLLQVLRVREMRTIKSNIITPLPQLLNPSTGLLHSKFSTVSADTWRLASSQPNLMSIPVRSKLGKRIRTLFAAEEGDLMLVADKSQIEPRIMAHEVLKRTGDDSLAKVYLSNPPLDLYKYGGNKVLGIPYEHVVGEKRDLMKTVMLAAQYVASPYRLAKSATKPTEDPPIVVSIPEAEMFLGGYFRGFPGIKTYMFQAIREAREQGYIATEYGNRRWLPSITSKDPGDRSGAERQAVNHPVQGLAAVLFRLAIVALHKAGLGPYLRNVVHDEVVLSGPANIMKDALPLVKEVMEGVYPQLLVPIVVNPAVGKSWADAK